MRCAIGRPHSPSPHRVANSGRTNWKYDRKTASFCTATAFAAYADEEADGEPERKFYNDCWNDHWSEFGKPTAYKQLYYEEDHIFAYVVKTDENIVTINVRGSEMSSLSNWLANLETWKKSIPCPKNGSAFNSVS